MYIRRPEYEVKKRKKHAYYDLHIQVFFVRLTSKSSHRTYTILRGTG